MSADAPQAHSTSTTSSGSQNGVSGQNGHGVGGGSSGGNGRAAESGGIYARAVTHYWRAGWRGLLPVPPEKKFPPPEGYTGATGADTPAETVAAWAGGAHAGDCIALRLPEGVIGIDVDHYIKGGKDKRGADTLREKEAEWGPLPPTWHSTARGVLAESGEWAAGPSRILLYRVPEGRYAAGIGSDIEVIQHHHRYCVVWPSVHDSVVSADGTPGVYRWYRPDGSVADEGEVPNPDDLPELPEAWVRGLAEGASRESAMAAEVGEGQALVATLMADERTMCADMASARDWALLQLGKAGVGARHDVMTARVHSVVSLGAHGHGGAGEVLRELRVAWDELVSGEDRGHEFDNMVLSSARKAVTDTNGLLLRVGVGAVVDPCLMVGVVSVGAPAPGDDRGSGDGLGGDSGDGFAAMDELAGDAVSFGWRQYIGVGPFEPSESTDQGVAEAALARCVPMLRFASDTRGWLRRGPMEWELHGDLTRRAISELAPLMPRGDPDLPAKKADYTAENRQYALRAAMHSNGRATAVSAMMRAVVAGGLHFASVRVGDLDTNPEILWAGGLAWDLRASADGPVAAALDPSTPHLVSAAVAPAVAPTPLWDAFLAAVWPDAEVRQWALRVLSIILTGYPDAALPILLGSAGTGKSSVVTLLMSVLGSYAHAANPKLLSGDSGHDSIVFALKGRRMSVIDEGPREGKWAQERLKQLTGGSPLTGNPMYQNPITFNPTHTLVLTANDEPILTDVALRRRVRLIPCEGDPDAVREARRLLVGDAWAREAPGVLAMMMSHTARWLADQSSGLTSAAPVSIRDVADEIGNEQDPVRQWVDEMCVPNEEGTRAGALYEKFVAWCRARNFGPGRIPTMTKWGRELTKQGYPVSRRREGKYRPLSIWDGGGGWSYPERPSGSTVTVKTEISPGARLAAPGDQLVHSTEGQLVTPENRRSNPVFTSSVNSVNSSLNTINTWKNKEEEGEGGGIEKSVKSNGGLLCTGHSGVVETPLTSGVPGLEQDPKVGQLVTTGQRPVNDLEEAADSSPPVIEGPLHPQRAEVAKLADGNKITKAEARARIVAERKARHQADAVAEAAGEQLSLPAVVDRAGHVVPVSEAQAVMILESCLARTGGTLTVDVETSGYPVGHRDHVLRMVQLGDALAAVVLDPVAHAEIITRFLTETTELLAFSATADLVPLAHAGLVDAESVWGKMSDVVNDVKLALPQSVGSESGLKPTAALLLGDDALTPKTDEARLTLFKAAKWITVKQRFADQLATPLADNGWAQVDPTCATMLAYAGSDVLDTAAVRDRLPRADPEVLRRERVAEAMCSRVAHTGLQIDAERLDELTETHTARRTELMAQIRSLTALENPKSSPQCAEAFARVGHEVTTTAKGNPEVNDYRLKLLTRTQPDTPAGELAGLIRDWRKSDTVLNLFLKPYRILVESGDGRVRPTVYTLSAETGRMTSVRPNCQQLPKKGGIRSLYVADPGHCFISADFSGVELRGAAALSQDRAMMHMIAEEDAGRFDGFHWAVARMAFGPDATPADRSIAKRGVFGTCYGGGVATLARQVGVPEQEMAVIRDSLMNIAPTFFEWAEQLRQGIRRGRTEFRSYSGRVIHFPAATPHKGTAYAIQGSCRELLVDALLKWRETRWGRCPLLPIHDELIVMVPIEDAVVATETLVACMASELFGVKIVADPGDRATWGSTFWRDGG